MEEEVKQEETSGKPQPHRLEGAKDGVPFSKENQPSPEAKKAGWKKFREERHLTQSIIKMMIGEDGTPTETFKDYIAALVKNAKAGNPKAIDAINKCIEEEISKIEHSGSVTIPISGMEVH